MSSIDNLDTIDRLTEEVCEDLPYNPPVSEVQEKLSEYLNVGLNEKKAKQITIDVFAIRREVLDELEFEEETVVAYDLPTYNRTDWR